MVQQQRGPGLIVRRADVPNPPKWWDAEWTAIIIDGEGVYTRRVVQDDRPFEGGGFVDRDERVQDQRLARKITGFIRQECVYRISAASASVAE